MDRERSDRGSAEAPAAGVIVGGRVRLDRPLASGAMGSVWTGHHLALDVQVAVKFIRPEVFGRDPRAEQRFEREARAAARIKSPHVVQIFDCGITEQGAPYLVMELLEGETLGQRMERVGPLDAALVVAVVNQIGRALDRAHSLGIVHRDVKPQNIFLVGAGAEPLAKLLDFGIAKLTEVPVDHAATQTGVVVGTPQYMSPEQLLRPKEADHRGDLWALAVVAYHALAGRPPFAGETLAALIVSITQSKFARLRSYRPELPAALDAWFDRALDTEPSDRFATAAELGASFAASLELAVRSDSSSSLRLEGSDPPDGVASDPGAAATEALALDGSADTAAFVAARDLELEGALSASRPMVECPSNDEPAEPTASEPPERPPSRPPSETRSREGAPRGPRERSADAERATVPREGVASWRGRAAWISLALVGVAGGLIGLRAATSKPETGATEPAREAASAERTVPSHAPSAAAESTATALRAADAGARAAFAPATADSGGLSPTEIPAGRCAETNAWLPKFTVARYVESDGASWLEALDGCRERGSSLCTESQWARACESSSALGARPSWTASASGERGFVVRGGGGCAARAVAAGHTTDAARGAACCTRAVGLRSDSSSTAFLQTTSSRLLLLERALDGLDGQTLGEVLAAEVELGGAPVPREEVVARLHKQLGFARERGALHDLCEVRLTNAGGEPAWTAECRVVVRVDARVGYVLRRYLYGGPDGKLRVVAEPKVFRLPAPLGGGEGDGGP